MRPMIPRRLPGLLAPRLRARFSLPFSFAFAFALVAASAVMTGCSSSRLAKTEDAASAGKPASSTAPSPATATPAATKFQTATRENVQLLQGAELRLIRLIDSGRLVKLGDGQPVSLRLAPDGKVNGRAPVNRFFGRFEFGFDGTIKWPLAALGTTRMAGSPADMKLENQFFQTLTATTRLQVSDKAVRFENNDHSMVVEFEKP